MRPMTRQKKMRSGGMSLSLRVARPAAWSATRCRPRIAKKACDCACASARPPVLSRMKKRQNSRSRPGSSSLCELTRPRLRTARCTAAASSWCAACARRA